MNFFEFDTLEKELEILPPFHQVAFAAACCERMLPNYNAFSRMYSWGNSSVPKNALDEVWQILEGKAVDPAKIEQLIEACGDEHIFPDDLDFGGQYCMEAQEALQSIIYTLSEFIKPNLNYIVKVAKSARTTVEAHIDTVFRPGENKSEDDIASHPLAVREMAKEAEDLQRLKETESLDKDFLEWLRTSFDNDGKSLIDLG